MYAKLLELAILSAIEAGEVILDYYHRLYRISVKEDKSLVTEADIAANQIISTALSVSKLPIISEESAQISYKTRALWSTCWLVDPLDGTKEFIHRNGEFTVNIALINDGMPVLGVIYAPISGDLYFASPVTKSIKAHVTNKTIDDRSMQTLPLTPKHQNIRIAVSRSHLDEKTISFVEAIKEKYCNTETITSGSSIKLCKVAEGLADVYPRFGKTMEWDTAAGHAILLYAGANIYDIQSLKELQYNKPSLQNPDFIAFRNDFKEKLTQYHI